jgi:hypothetical protein
VTPPAAPADPLARVADLIRDVGLAAERARRYRALATSVAEPAFERALAIGASIRRSLRDPERQRADAGDAARELETLLDRCTRAVVDVQASAVYHDAVAAVAAGATGHVATLAPLLFSDVEPFPDARVLYWPVPIAGPRSAGHFLPPEECAARIAEHAADGLVATLPPPELGADEHIPAIVLSAEHDVAESPIALAIEASALGAPLCRLGGGTTAFFYAPRVRVSFRVRTAAIVSDEWWAVRPDAYRAYVEALRDALAPTGIGIETAP